MEFFNNAKAVRLKSHLDKYLTADDDQITVRQSQNGVSKKARWIVEFVQGNPHVIRLKASHGGYLMASDEPFLLGMTGKKVMQSAPNSKKDGSIEWEPIKEGYCVKLRTRGGKFLRANGGTIPWRNSITHDLPHRTATQDWISWHVDLVDISALEHEYLPSNASSFSSINDDYSASNSPDIRSITNHATSMSIKSPFKRSVLPDQNKWLSMPPERSSNKSDGMEFFDKAKAVRLQSHFGKYLVADDDEVTVRQSRNGSSNRARWNVEFVGNRIRFKSCHGLYLTATKEAFLLGVTGKKVLQTFPGKSTDALTEWEPVKDGLNVKLMTSDGKFLRANGGTPPWNNSVTHDIPRRTATQEWVLWGVDIVDITLSDNLDLDSGSTSPRSSINSATDDDYCGTPDNGSPMVSFNGRAGRVSGLGSVDFGSSQMRLSRLSGNVSMNQASGMEFFKKAKTVRLKSHHEKYLTADSDEKSVIQDRSGTSRNCKWSVEFVEGVENVLRLKSCYGSYLTATDDEVLLGMTGRKVVQSVPQKLGSSIQWEPVRDGMQVKLKTRYGNFLRANGGMPPWRNSVTHDIPHRHHDWILWVVDVIEILPESPIEVRPESPPKVSQIDSSDDDSDSSFPIKFQAYMSSGSLPHSMKKPEGRLIYYHVVKDDGSVNDAIEGISFQFLGHGLEELVHKLEEETGLDDIIVCSRNNVNGKLYRLRLALPPNNATMHVVVIPSTSTAAKDFMPAAPTSG